MSKTIRSNMGKPVKKVKKTVNELKTQTAKKAEETSRKVGDAVTEAGFWEEATENISEGARIVGEEARLAGEKISAYSEILFGKIKDMSSDFFESGLNLTREAVNKAQKLGEDFRDNIQIKNLNKQKKEVATRLGMKFYLEVKSNDNKIPGNICNKRVFLSLLKEIEKIDKEILEISTE